MTLLHDLPVVTPLKVPDTRLCVDLIDTQALIVIPSKDSVIACLLPVNVHVDTTRFDQSYWPLVARRLAWHEYRLSLGMLMHVKCIYKLCTLLLDIPTYLQLIRCYVHVL
jgi:hypothetical protein